MVEDNNRVDSAANPKEKNPDELTRELVDTLKNKDDELENQLLAKISGGAKSLLLFNSPDETSGVGYGVDPEIGPVTVGREQTKELLSRKRLSSGEIIYTYAHADAGGLLNSVQQVDHPDVLVGWQKTYEQSLKTAARLAESIKVRREILPKALDFVKSLNVEPTSTIAEPDATKAPMDMVGGGFEVPAKAPEPQFGVAQAAPEDKARADQASAIRDLDNGGLGKAQN